MSDVKMMPLPDDMTKAVTATDTGTALDGLRAQLKEAVAAGATVQAPKKETHSVVIGGISDTAPAIAGTAPGASAAAGVAPMPENGVAKFYNPETGEYNWQGHAVEAEFRAKMAKGKKEKVADDPQATPEQATPEKVVSTAGLDWETLGEKISVLGDIDEDDYDALEKVGIPRHVVEAHIDGYKATVELSTQKLYQKTGGKEGAEALMTWARQNLPNNEITAYDKMLASDQWPVAIDALIARSGFRPTKEPQLVRPAQVAAVASSGGYNSQDEHLADIRNPLYRTSEAFRQQVYRKLAATPSQRPGGPFRA